jgi:hypothetical protein
MLAEYQCPAYLCSCFVLVLAMLMLLTVSYFMHAPLLPLHSDAAFHA